MTKLSTLVQIQMTPQQNLKINKVCLIYLMKPLKGIMILEGDQVNPLLEIMYSKEKVLPSQIWIMIKHH